MDIPEDPDQGIDLGDGYGPFIIAKPFLGAEDQLEFSITVNVGDKANGYADSVASKAKDELNSITKGSHVESNLRTREKELKNRIEKAYTKSKKPEVRQKYKTMRDVLNAELLKVQDELKDIEMRRK